jgi:peptide/nickel transport system ATP-binding protein
MDDPGDGVGTSLLEVTDLNVAFSTPDGVLQAVRGLSFTVEEGKTLGIVGESGSGKSVSTQTIVGLTKGARVSGRALFEGRDLLTMPDSELRQIRGAEIGMIFQDPLSSLHPNYRVGWQIMEMITAHEQVSKKQAHRRAVELLGLVGIPAPEKRADDYPHQFSGGMRQRAMIAMALALNPKLLIADEPTTALDVTVQAQIIALIKRLQGEFGTAVILITHDLGVIADIADRVIVMYAGKAMESAETRTLYHQPHHPYTEGLIRSLPQRGNRRSPLRSIAGLPPSLLRVPQGCPFHPRCDYAMDRCLSLEPPMQDAVGGQAHVSACWLPPDAVGTDASSVAVRLEAMSASGAASAGVTARVESDTLTAEPLLPEASVTGPETLLELVDVVKRFPVRSQQAFGRVRDHVQAVDGISLTVRRGETLGLVGETGCGKSTLARCIMRLHDLTSGTISFDGDDISAMSPRQLRSIRRKMQMVFQDPYGSLNPRRRIGSIIADPFIINGTESANERKCRVQELMDLVGLNPEHYNRFPAEFSGGQRQRIGLARALALRPELVVCDEPVSALDVSIQAQIINLLADLQQQLGLTYIFIAHDLSVVRHVSDRIAVMYLGRIVEIAETEELFARPRHPYTQSLLSAVPDPDPDLASSTGRPLLTGDVPSPIHPPAGCRFHPRCPRAQERCQSDDPGLTFDGGTGDSPHGYACHFPLTDDMLQPVELRSSS